MMQTGNTYQLQPSPQERFYPSRVRAIIQQVLSEKLKGLQYNVSNSAELSQELARTIRARVKDLKMPRYKIGVQIMFGELKGQGIRVASKCLWDANFDNWASFTFRNQYLHCTAIVFGVYFE